MMEILVIKRMITDRLKEMYGKEVPALDVAWTLC